MCSISSSHEMETTLDREIGPEPGHGETSEDSEQEAEKVPETPSLFAESRLPIVDEIMAGHMSFKLILITSTQKPGQDVRKSKTTNFLTVSILRARTN